MQYVVGAAMLDGELNLSHFTKEAVADPIYKEACSKVKVLVNNDFPPEKADRPFDVPERVVIKMKDGREFSGERLYPVGSPQDPLNAEQVVDLYRKYTAGVLSRGQIERTAECFLNLDKLSDVEELMDILTFRHKSAL